MNKRERVLRNKQLGIKRFQKYHGYHPDQVPEDERDSYMGGIESHVGCLGRTGKPCSCHMCCNERRSKLFSEKDKLTMQERRSNEDMENQIKEL